MLQRTGKWVRKADRRRHTLWTLSHRLLPKLAFVAAAGGSLSESQSSSETELLGIVILERSSPKRCAVPHGFVNIRVGNLLGLNPLNSGVDDDR